MKNIFKKTDSILKKTESAICTAALTVSMAAPALVAQAADGKSLVSSALEVIGVIAFIPAAFYLVMGIYHYAVANSEGDGPATGKATKQIVSGVMIGILAAAMKVAGTPGTAINKLIEGIFG